MTGVATTAEPPTAAATIARAAAGDRVAFTQIVNAYHADMARVAYVVSGDPTIAEDAVQAAWSISWRKLGSLRDPDRLRPWLVSVAANEARQMLRRQHRTRIDEIDARPHADNLADPSDAIDRLDLVNALGHLKPEDRALVALRYVAGLGSDEIASLTGMSASGVRGRLSRVLARLRKELRDG